MSTVYAGPERRVVDRPVKVEQRADMRAAQIKAQDRHDRIVSNLLLFGAGAIVAAVIGLALVVALGGDNQWAAVEYTVPIEIVEADGTVPSVDGVDAPSFYDQDYTRIPARLERIVDCENYTCPAESLPYEITIRWQLMKNGVAQTTQFTALQRFDSALVEGEDYIRGEKGTYITQLNPFSVTDQVSIHNKQDGVDVSSWRIEGEVQFKIEGADPVAWATGVFNVYEGGFKEAGDGL